MKLFQPFEALIKNGVSLTFKIAAAGDQIQLDILPAGKDTKTGVTLPPRALLGTAAELDENLESFVEKYASSVQRIADVVAGADQDLQQAEAAAANQARKAVEDKRSTTKTPKPAAGGKSGTSAPKRRDLSAGMMGEGGSDEGGEDDDNDGDAGGDDAATTLNTGGTAGSPSAATSEQKGEAQTGETNALSPTLF